MLSKHGKKLDSSESSHHVSSLRPKESANHSVYPPLNIIHPSPQPHKEMQKQKPLFDPQKMEHLTKTEPAGFSNDQRPIPCQKTPSSSGSNMTESQLANTPDFNTKPNKNSNRDAPLNIVHQSPQPHKEMQKPLLDPKKMETLTKPEPAGFSNHHRSIPNQKTPCSSGSNKTEPQLANTPDLNTKPNKNSNRDAPLNIVHQSQQPHKEMQKPVLDPKKMENLTKTEPTGFSNHHRPIPSQKIPSSSGSNKMESQLVNTPNLNTKPNNSSNRDAPLNMVHQSPQPHKEIQKPLFDPKKMENLTKSEPAGFSTHHRSIPSPKIPSGSNMMESQLANTPDLNTKPNKNNNRDAPLNIIHQSPQPHKEMQKPLFDPKKMENLTKTEPAGFSNHHHPIPSQKTPSSSGSNMMEPQPANTANLNTKPNNNSKRDAPLNIVHQSPQPHKEMQKQKPLFDPKKMENLTKPEPAGFSNHHCSIPSQKIPYGSDMESELANRPDLNTKPNNNSNRDAPLNIVHQSPQPHKEMQKPLFDPKKMEHLIEPEPAGFSNHHRPIPSQKTQPSSGSNKTEPQLANTPDLNTKQSKNSNRDEPLNIIHQSPQPHKEMQKQKPLFDPKKMENLTKPEPAGFSNHHRSIPDPKIPSSSGSNMTESQLANTPDLNTKPNKNSNRDAPLNIVHQSPQPHKEMHKPLFDPKKMENLIKPEPAGFSNHHRPITSPKNPSGSNMMESQLVNTPDLNTKPNKNSNRDAPLNIVHQSPQPHKEMQKPLFDPKKMENLIKPEPAGFSNHHRPITSPKIPSGSNMTESQLANTPDLNTKPNKNSNRDAPLNIVHPSPQPHKEMQKPLFDRKKMENLIKPEPAGFSNHHRSIPSPKIPSSPGSNMTENTSNLHTKPNNNSNSNNNSNMSSRNNSIESTSSNPSKPHTGGDIRWDAVNMMTSRGVQLGISDFRLLKRLGYGDIGSVYLVELRGTNTYFAMKVMDRASLASRNKLLRAQTEREILSQLDHPFLPTLYSHFETDKFYCLVMEFCSGGNLYSLRQKQPNKCFIEEAARFFASEVLLALEYLHMLGIVYRDLKPENVLVRDDGHIMLSDFDLSLRCSVSPTLVKSSSNHAGGSGSGRPVGLIDEDSAVQGCAQPSTFFPRILQSSKKNKKAKSDFGLFVNGSMPELMAEPTNVKSMSFVGTHEYLAPEIIRGEGHGSAVDWWTLGIFIYELLYGSTPFKGQGNRATLHNVIGQPLKFPDLPHVSSAARDLIKGLLVKEPQKRIAYKRGATEIKQHPFFEGVNWALIRSATPPHVPEPVDFTCFASKDKESMAVGDGGKKSNNGGGGSNPSHHDPDYIDFEYF